MREFRFWLREHRVVLIPLTVAVLLMSAGAWALTQLWLALLALWL